MNRWLERYVKKTNSNTVGAVETSEGAVVFVKRKMPLAELHLKVSDKQQPEWRKQDIVEETLRTGLFTKKPAKVIELGEVTIQGADRGIYRPVVGGCEIQPMGVPHVGTAGAIIKYYSWNNMPLVGWKKSFVSVLEKLGRPVTIKHGIITNAHVANKDMNKLEIGTWINQPYDGGTVGSVILNLGSFDASFLEAHAELHKEILVVGKPRKHRRPFINEEAHKYGRTTKYTEGTVLYAGATIQVNYGEAGIKTMTNCVIFSPMSASGDSGSVIVAKNDQAAIALLFAGSPQATIAMPISDVFEEAGVWL